MPDDMFPGPTVADVTLEQQIEEVKRELGMRAQVYPRRVAAGGMTQRAADRQTLVLEAVLMTLEGAVLKAVLMRLEGAARDV